MLIDKFIAQKSAKHYNVSIRTACTESLTAISLSQGTHTHTHTRTHITLGETTKTRVVYKDFIERIVVQEVAADSIERLSLREQTTDSGAGQAVVLSGG